MALAGAWGEIIVFIVKADAGKNRKRALGREDGWGQSSGGRSVREVVMAPPLHFGIDNHDEDDYGHHHCQDHRHYYQDFQLHHYQSVGSPISIMGPSFHSVLNFAFSVLFWKSSFTHHILHSVLTLLFGIFIHTSHIALHCSFVVLPFFDDSSYNTGCVYVNMSKRAKVWEILFYWLLKILHSEQNFPCFYNAQWSRCQLGCSCSQNIPCKLGSCYKSILSEIRVWKSQKKTIVLLVT